MGDSFSVLKEIEEKLTPKARDYLARAFIYHPPTDPRLVSIHTQIRQACMNAAAVLTFLPNNQERRLALEAIENACMWGNACIAREHEAILESMDGVQE
jgi:hypothetical protein